MVAVVRGVRDGFATRLRGVQRARCSQAGGARLASDVTGNWRVHEGAAMDMDDVMEVFVGTLLALIVFRLGVSRMSKRRRFRGRLI